MYVRERIFSYILKAFLHFIMRKRLMMLRVEAYRINYIFEKAPLFAVLLDVASAIL